jgi:outer membrane protein
MRKGFLAILCACCMGFFCSSPSAGSEVTIDLEGAVRYALEHNPSLRISEKDIATEGFGIDAAWADRMPKVDFGSGATTYRYAQPLTPIVLTPPLTPTLTLPNFEKTIYDAGASFRLPLYRGGRIAGNIRIAEMRKALAKDNYRASSQDLIYNLTSVYHKILQLQKLLQANEASVAQFESHERDVATFLKAGSVPRLDLLKTEVELAHAREDVLLVRNNLASAFELLKTLMGMEESDTTISLVEPPQSLGPYSSEEESIATAFLKRPDFQAVAKKKAIAEDRIRVARGMWFPDVYGSGQYVKRGADATSYKEDWYMGLRLTLSVFDGGLIRSEVNKEKTELEKVRQEERALKLAIHREVRDAHLGLANALDRIKVAETALVDARERLRVERLKYETGSGTSTEVIDAQTALLRSENDYYQALYDREIALASLRKAVGEYPAGVGGP